MFHLHQLAGSKNPTALKDCGFFQPLSAKDSQHEPHMLRDVKQERVFGCADPHDASDESSG